VRVALAALCAAMALAVGSAAGAQAYAPPPIRHVFVVVLENESSAVTFGPDSPAPYLAHTLTGEGAFLADYHAIGHESLDNYIAMISGQAPNPFTQTDCQVYENLVPGTLLSDAQADGVGCIYPSDVPTIASQLDAAGLTWRDYDQSMGADPAREAAECGHPGVGQIDTTQSATATDQYATRHNPFMYFHSIIDDTTLCDSHVVNLDLLPGDLTSAADTPNYVFITPDLCSDGHDATCADKSRPGGFGGIEQFLQQWVPTITGSPAFQQNGLLIITFDESQDTDATSCCGEVPGPGTVLPGLLGPGGGTVGAVLLSPFIAPGTVSNVPYNHYSMLRSVEDLFGLSHLGEAADAGEQSFGPDVYTRAAGPPAPAGPVPAPAKACTAKALPRRAHGHLASGTLIEGVALVRARTRAAIVLHAVHAAVLRVTVRPGHGRSRTLLTRRIARCRAYRVTLPRGHGRVQVAAIVAQGAQTTIRHY
jgi:hypothetical protein